MNVKKKQIIASRLKLALEIAGLTQNQIAKLLKMNRPTISEIEADRRNVSAQELANFSEIYDVNVAWLLNDESEKLEESTEFKLAAMELSKLKPDELDKLLKLLTSIKTK